MLNGSPLRRGLSPLGAIIRFGNILMLNTLDEGMNRHAERVNPLNEKGSYLIELEGFYPCT